MTIPLEHQVCSLDLSKRLKELGVKQESEFFWVQYQDEQWNLCRRATTDDSMIRIPAFTVAELGEMLKNNNVSSGYSQEDVGWWCQSSTHNKFDIVGEDTEADARAKMLIYLLENKLITL